MKIGDKVKIINKKEDNNTGISYQELGCNLINPKSFIGLEGKIIGVNVGSTTFRVDQGDKYLGLYREEDLELVSEDKLIIHCPTKEEAERVLDKVGKYNHIDKEEWLDCWDNRKEQACYRIENSEINGYGSLSCYQEYKNTDYKDYTFLTAQEYLGEETAIGYDTGSEDGDCTVIGTVSGNGVFNIKKIINKPEQEALNNKPMLKSLTKTLKRVLSKDLQAQYKADYINGDLELTERGKEELLRILAVEKEKELAESAREYIKDCENK